MPDTIDASLKTAAKGTTLVFIGMVASILLWFATKILIIRNVTKEELGFYSIVVAVMGIFALVASLGLQEGISRYVSIFRGEGKNDRAASAAIGTVQMGMISSLAAFILLYLFSGVISRDIFYKPNLEVYLKVISFLIPFSVMASIFGGVLRGYNSMTQRVYTDMGQPLFFLIFLSISIAVGFPFIGIIYSYVLSMAGVCFFVGFYLFHKTGLNPLSVLGGSDRKELLGFSIPLLAVSFLLIVLAWTDTIMLGRYATAEEVGVYNVSVSLAKLIAFPLEAFGFVFMPLAGEMFVKKRMTDLKRTYQVLTKWIFSATLPIFFILIFFPEMTITFLFGSRFTDASTSLRILSLAFLFSSFTGANSILMVVLGMTRALMSISIFGTILNILLNYIFVKLLGLGIVGSAVATLISYICLNGFISIELFRQSGIHFITPQYIKPVLGSAVLGLAIYAVAKSVPLFLWMMPFYLLLFIVGYGMVLHVTGSIDKEDVALLTAIMEKTGVEPKWLQKVFNDLQEVRDKVK